MASWHTLLVAFLEVTFIIVALCLLHRLRKQIGGAAFQMLFGTLLVLAQFIAAAQLELRCGHILWIDFTLPMGLVAVMMPCLAALLLVYANDGPLSTQRLIVGTFASVGMFYYLCKLTQIQLDWAPYALNAVSPGATLREVLDRVFSAVAGSLLSLLVAVLVMPVVYTGLRRVRLPLYFSIFGALWMAMLGATLIYLPFGVGSSAQGWLADYANLAVIHSVEALYLAAIITLYLTRVEREKEVTNARPLEIVLAFFGGYGRLKALEENLSEWENRHRIIMQSATDMILLLDQDGVIQDANAAAAATLRYPTPTELAGVNFFKLIGMEGNMTAELDAKEAGHGLRRKIKIRMPDNSIVFLDLVLSEARLRARPMFILVGRDITEETKLAGERASLAEQVAHLQRLEALGRLTGGIAHDFNNYIHAILGHLDLLELKYNLNDPELLAHVHKIGDVAEQAGKLTGQLLGFARKGKYQVVEIDLRELVNRAVELFMPNKAQMVDIELQNGDTQLNVKGDPVQLQQVMLNLLFNAFDAMKKNPPERPGHMVVATGEAAESPVPPEPPRVVGSRGPRVRVEDYYFVMVRDNGCGMDQATLEHAFDPFFTTKPVGEGSGMGLPMVYGAVTNHYGWVQIKSKLDFGTSVLLFLPKSTVTPKPIQAEVIL
ncbi:MAG: ATP-binding protein [Victivallaceae bacterium]|nr:ATP-binding protein [Victivallaceae bacterium]